MSSIYDQLSKAELSPKPDITDSDVAIPKLTVTGPLGQPRRSYGLKIVAGLSFLLSLAACFFGFYIYTLFEQEKAGREQLIAQFQQLKGGSDQLQEKTFAYRGEVDDLQKEFQRLRNDGQIMKKELERGRFEVSNIQKKILELEDKNQQIEAAVSELRRPPMAPVGAESYFEQSNFTSPDDLSQTGVSENDTPAEAETPSVDAFEDVPAVSYPKIMTVNRKFNFVVLNMGSKDDLRMGDRLVVERDGKAIGSVAVEKLYDNFAAAAIVEEKQSGEIKEGDIVRKS